MNISYDWLKDLIELDLTAEQAAAELTRVGLAVEGIHPHGDDLVLDIDLTSNRPDCLSHIGVARELGVSTGKPLKLSDSSQDIPVPAVLAESLVKIEDPDLCNRFTARIIRNVKVGPSPQWLVDRLEAIGERPINNIADITNYVMHELGQPMHAFDLDKLAENRIVVRRAGTGETITTLDEADRTLDTRMLCICDAEKPAAIGGIMGGLASSITESTVNVILEVAYFNRANIRSTSRRLNLATEASYRFERGVDINNLIRASNRAAQLIVDLAGGELTEFVDVFPTQWTANEVISTDISAATARLTGMNVAKDDCDRILAALGIEEKGDSTYSSPSWRHDIAIEEDLVEEVARHAGYENIADELPPTYGAGEYQPTEHRERVLRQTLVNIGFDEAISYSFIDAGHDEVFDLAPGIIDTASDARFVTLQDSVIEGAVRMRPTILPGLLDAVRVNLNHQRRDLKLFELGKVFASGNGEDGLPAEHEILAIALTGGEILQDRAMASRPLDLYDTTGAIQAALEALGHSDVRFAEAESRHLRSGQAASISIGEKVVGSVGRLNDEISAAYKFKQPVYLGEVNLDLVLAQPTITAVYRPLSRFPGISRDVSFAVPRSITFAEIRSAVTEQRVELCRGVDFVDVYEGKGLADTERSITIRLQYRSPERTLIEDEVEALHQQIVTTVEQNLSIKQRA
ncbi:MAG: phenylalanine--tRNA ligase subunit beta [Chloracidobacterium sp.]|nr:phenylalanine--tRNA ligase subunit beta [Chloracidobacterium sp.]